MKTFYPIILSLAFMIPFSPVGGYLWQQSQQLGNDLMQQSQSLSQQGREEASTMTSQFAGWFSEKYQDSRQYVDERGNACAQAVDHSHQFVQQGIASGTETLQQQWALMAQAFSHHWHSGLQTLQSQSLNVWHTVADSGVQLKDSLQELFEQSVLGSEAAANDTADPDQQSLAANDTQPSPP